jgi:hypothetical protein
MRQSPHPLLEVVKMAAEMIVAEKPEAEMCCPMCTHTVQGAAYAVKAAGWQRKWAPVPGQKCPRCWTSLDAAFIVRLLEPKPNLAAKPKAVAA